MKKLLLISHLLSLCISLSSSAQTNIFNEYFQDSVYTFSLTHGEILKTDMDLDGNIDVISLSSSSTDIAVMLGDGNGTFDIDSVYNVGGWVMGSSGLTIADFNGDNYPDLAVTNSDYDSVMVFLNLGNGDLSNSTNTFCGTGLMKLTSADFNEDGNQDIIAGNNSAFTLFIGNGNGTFQLGINTVSGNCCDYGVEHGDFNGDNNLDVAVGNYVWNGGINIYYGDGSGGFSLNTTHTYNAFVNNFKAIDFDLDNDLDIVILNEDTLRILENNGTGLFTDNILYDDFSSSLFHFDISDIDNDGDNDIVVIDDSVKFFNNDLVQLNRDTTIFVGISPGAIILSNFDSDNINDFVVQFGSSIISYLTVPNNGSTVNLIERENGQFLLFPNPTNGNFSINLGNNSSYIKVCISDINGRLIQLIEHNNSQFLNLNLEQPAGIYFLTIESEGQRSILRLVKH